MVMVCLDSKFCMDILRANPRLERARLEKIIAVSTVVNLLGRLFLSSSSNCFRYISKCRFQYCGNFSYSAKQFYAITKGLSENDLLSLLTSSCG